MEKKKKPSGKASVTRGALSKKPEEKPKKEKEG